jgi:spore maturation protein CgeB
MTQYHKGIEKYFNIDKEIITYKTSDEFIHKYNFLKTRPKIVKQIAMNGHKRFLKEHESKIRLASILKEIENF